MILKRHLILLLLAPVILASSSLAKGPKIYPSVPGEYVVKLKSEANAKGLNTFEDVALQLQKKTGVKSNFLTTVQVRHMRTTNQYAVIIAKNVQSAQALLAADDRVAYAEPNYLYHTMEIKEDHIKIQAPSRVKTTGSAPVNDAQFDQLWGMQNTGQTDAAGQVGRAGSDIGVVPLWKEGVTGNKSVKVAIIDTGVDYTHPDLADNILKNAGEIAGDGIDNDGNGFIDDVYGWDFANNKANAMDDHDHGSHCAGTIGAMANNSVGVAGVNWNVSILPVKFLNSQGSGTLDAAVQAIQYATKAGVSIMSNSWGGGPFTQSLYDAINEARAKGILFVAAAGNDSSDNDATPSYPASYDLDNIISVAATDNKDQIASFSNFGITKVHVAAPGVKILSTTKGNTYQVFSGTSMATPHVSGIAALLLSTNPSYTYTQIKNTLIATSDKVRGLSKKVVAKGRVNVYNAVHGIIPPDNTPDESLWKDYAYTVETPHPYVENQTYAYNIDIPNVKYVRVVFDAIDTEAGYDRISVRDVNGDEIENLSGTYAPGYTSDYMAGGKATITFKTDSSVNKNGFKVQKLQVIY